MAQTFSYVMGGNETVVRALNRLQRITYIRAAVRPPARAGLRPVVRAIGRTASRTHPLSLRRPPVGSRRGPMSKFLAIRTISARSKLVGARTIFDSRRFAGVGSAIGPRLGFVVRGRKTGKRAFYPAAQELGAAGANPPIQPQRQTERAADQAQGLATSEFEKAFGPNYDKVANRAFKRSGA